MYRLLVPALLLLLSCQQQQENTIGSIERLDPALDALIDQNAAIELLAQGFEWSEGPLWIEEENMLLFSDVPTNLVYKWTEAKGKETYLTPSGYTGSRERGGETGSNGLTRNKNGQLVLCQHGNRQVALMDAPLHSPKPVFIPIAQQYEGKRFNSPNDLVYDARGNLYFTDPPYGLEQNMEDSSKEIPFQGVYRVDTSGTVTLLVDSLTRPNGIALTPDGKQLYIANSDPQKAYWYRYDLTAEGSLANGTVFYDATADLKKEAGNPDGLKVDKSGNVFASGPGGIWIFNAAGKVLGKIKTPQQASNCAFSTDEKTLFITADNYVLRVKLRK